MQCHGFCTLAAHLPFPRSA